MQSKFPSQARSRRHRSWQLLFRPRVLSLEDRIVPGDTLLGALTAPRLVLPQAAAQSAAMIANGKPPPAAVVTVAPRPQLLPLPAGSGRRTHVALALETQLAPDPQAWSVTEDLAQLVSAFAATQPPRALTPIDQNGLDGREPADGAIAGVNERSTPRPLPGPSFAPATPGHDPYTWVFGPGTGGPSVRAPRLPVIIDPNRDGAVVSTSVHMETQPFTDTEPGRTHAASEWEIYTNEPGSPERIWSRQVAPDEPDRSLLTHIHLADGLFEGSHAGQTLLRPSTNYLLRVRFENDLGEQSEWAERTFLTQTQIPGDPDNRWAARQPGYQVEVMASDLKLPVNIAFVPEPSYQPGTPLYYVTELYGEVKVVTADGHVRRFAGGDAQDPAERPNSLVNFNPTGAFPGSGEQGLTGIVVDPTNGDVYVSTVWSIAGDAPGSPHYGRVFRLESDDGGLTAARRVLVFDTACQLDWQGENCGEEQGQSHQISNLTFGPDGYLYVHNGEGFDIARAQNIDSYGGKILRLGRDGLPSAENPHFLPDCTNPATGRPCTRNFVYASGFRNPFGGAWWARNNRQYTVENGPDTNDRLSELVAGRNYGWNGFAASMTTHALYNWAPPQAPVNIAFIQPETFGGSGFPEDKWDHAFVSNSGPTYGEGPQAYGKRIQEFVLDPKTGERIGGPTTLVEYTGIGRASVGGLAAGPDGLYFTDIYRDDGVGGPAARGANVYRVRSLDSVNFSADVHVACSAPLTVQFTDRTTGGPPIFWLWLLGDGEISLEQNPQHTYAQAGTYDVTLIVIDAEGTPRWVTRPAYVGAGRVGLRAEGYAIGAFDEIYQYSGPRQARVDPTVDSAIGGGLEFPELGTTHFFTRWTGQLQSLDAGSYTFSTVSDDGIRLWVDNQLLIDNWIAHDPTTDTATITLAADQAYDIRLDYYQSTGTGEARLRWTPPGQAEQVIPQAQLCPTMTSTAVTPPSLLRTTSVNFEQIDLAWQNNADNATAILVERSTDGQTFVPRALLEPRATTYVDPLDTLGRYFYRVWAINPFGATASNTIDVSLGLLDFLNGFGNPVGLTANGDALFTEDVARLTTGEGDRAGSFFADERMGITSWLTMFTFQIRPGTPFLADGLAFVIQGNDPTALGPTGGGLGYGPDQPGCCGIANSVAIKFDVYDNAGEGDNSTGLFTDGASPTLPRPESDDVLMDLNGTGIDLLSQHVFQVFMVYQELTLVVLLVDTETQALALQIYVVDIPAKVGSGTAHVGFTGATGNLTAIHEVRSWRFESYG